MILVQRVAGSTQLARSSDLAKCRWGSDWHHVQTNAKRDGSFAPLTYFVECFKLEKLSDIEVLGSGARIRCAPRAAVSSLTNYN